MLNTFFHSLTNLPSASPAPAGERIRVEHVVRYDEFGTPYLIESGRYDQYEVIQSFKDECDLDKILLRYANGDVFALNKAQGLYADVVGYPDTIPAAYAAMQRLEDTFNELDPSVRGRFKDLGEFVSACTSAFAQLRPDSGAPEEIVPSESEEDVDG